MKASELDNKFDLGQNITDALDLSNSKRINLKAKRINLDVPEWMITKVDKEASRLGVTRQSIIKFWLSEKLDGIN
jgi:predicted DNA binding CopG/RHH family protein